MKIFSKEFYIFSDAKDLTIGEIRRQLLGRMLTFLVFFIIGTLIMGAAEALQLEQHRTAFFYLSFIVPLLIVLLFRKRLPYKLGVFIFLSTGYLTGVMNLIDYGFSGAGMPIFFTISVLATFLIGLRAGVITMLSCVVPMIIIAYLMTSGILEPIVDFNVIMHKPISWATFIVVMVFLSSIMIIGYGIIQLQVIFQ